VLGKMMDWKKKRKTPDQRIPELGCQ
jgi:hypothetical protein